MLTEETFAKIVNFLSRYLNLTFLLGKYIRECIFLYGTIMFDKLLTYLNIFELIKGKSYHVNK